MSAEVKLAFSSTHRRVRAEFPAYAFGQESDFNALKEKVKKKLDGEIAKGTMEGYVLRFDELALFWGQEITASAVDRESIISFDVAQGWPKFKGVEITPPTEKDAVASISIKVPQATAKKVYFGWIEAMIESALNEMGCESKFHPSQLASLWLRVTHGATIENEQLAAKPELNITKPFQLVANRTRGELSIIISDPKLITEKRGRDSLIKAASDACQKVQAATKKEHLLLRKEMILDLEKYGSQLEALGKNLPAVILIGIAADSLAKQEQASSGKSKNRLEKKSHLKESYPGKGVLTIDVSPDKMEATIGEWDMAWYNSKEFDVSIDWIAKEVANAGITHGTRDHAIRLKEAIRQEKDLSDRIIAAGTDGTPGSKPYLHPVYLSRKAAELKDDEERSLRQENTNDVVKEGDLVADIRFQIKERPGTTVFGEACPPAMPEGLIVEVGDGIRQDGNNFYATMEGAPTVEKLSVSLTTKLVIKGDVNLKTGNVIFKGTVEVMGSVDDGATVEATGDLVVHGTIRGVYIRVGGSITCHRGIITGGRGSVRARADINSAFIENSRVACGGNVVVSRNIMNSDIFCGGAVELDTKTGVIAGGSLAARVHLRTGKLGLPKGAKTVINVGADWRAEMALQIRTKRLESVTTRLEALRIELRELTRKKKMQRSEKLEKKSADLQALLIKGRRVTEKVKEMIEEARRRIVYDPECRIMVHDILATNVDLNCGGQKIAVVKEVAAVEVTAKRRRGQFIHALEEKSSNKIAS